MSDNTGWQHKGYINGAGKYQACFEANVAKLSSMAALQDESIGMLHYAFNAYTDYFSAGGINRPTRLRRMVEAVELKRGSRGSAALQRLKQYSTRVRKELPIGLEIEYESIMDSVLEQYFGAVSFGFGAANWMPISSLHDSIALSSI